MKKMVVSGPVLSQVLKQINAENRRVRSISRGKSNAEWVLEIAGPFVPKPTQTEFQFEKRSALRF